MTTTCRKATVKPPDGGWGWVIVAASFWIHVIIDGMTFAFGVLAAEFVEDLGASRQLNGWITALLVGVILGAGPLVSLACDKFGNRGVTIFGAVLAWAGFAVSYFVTQPWMFLLTVSLTAGFGISLIYLPAIVSVGVYFEKRRSTAIGIAVCGSGVGIFAFGPLINYLIDEYTWRGAMLILAGVMLNCAVLGTLLRPLPAAVAVVERPLLPIAETGLPNSSAAAAPRTKERRAGEARQFMSLQNMAQQLQGRPSRTLSAGANLDATAEDAVTVDGGSAPPPPPPILLASRSAFVASALSLATEQQQQQQQQQAHQDVPEDAGRSVGFACGKLLPPALAAQLARLAKQLNLDLLKDASFLLLILSNLLFNVGFDAPFLYTPDRARQAGYSPKDSSLLLSVIGIANLIGRLVFGFVSDRERINKPALYAAALAIAGIALFFSFISSAYAFMAVYCSLFGVFVGAYVTMTPAVLADLVGADKLNDAFGLTLLFQGIGVLIGPPMAGALFDSTQSFNISYMASGCCMMLSGVMLFPMPCVIKWQAARSKVVRSNHITIEL